MIARKGGCACGAVRYVAETGDDGFAVCHCPTCRAWVGGPFAAMQAETLKVETGAEQVRVWTSSTWAERASCAVCGGALWYRLQEAPAGGPHTVAVGTLDDLTGLTLTAEIYSDCKPAAWGFLSEDSRRMTRAETEAMFASEAP